MSKPWDEMSDQERQDEIEKFKAKKLEWAIHNSNFIEHVEWARENSAALVCAFCGMQMDESEFEDEDNHDDECPNRGRNLLEENMNFLRERLGDEKFEAMMGKALAAVETVDAETAEEDFDDD